MSPASQARYDVNGRTVFITGAARGIGAATAENAEEAAGQDPVLGVSAQAIE